MHRILCERFKNIAIISVRIEYSIKKKTRFNWGLNRMKEPYLLRKHEHETYVTFRHFSFKINYLNKYFHKLHLNILIYIAINKYLLVNVIFFAKPFMDYSCSSILFLKTIYRNLYQLFIYRRFSIGLCSLF